MTFFQLKSLVPMEAVIKAFIFFMRFKFLFGHLVSKCLHISSSRTKPEVLFYYIFLDFKFQELYQLAQTVIGAHLMPTVMMANIEATLLLHNSVLMPMPPRLITLLYKNAKGQLNSLEKYGKKIFNYWYGFVEWYLQRKRSYLGIE